LFASLTLYPVLGQWEVIFNTIFLYNYKTINQQSSYQHC